jgi:hypothetical protein
MARYYYRRNYGYRSNRGVRQSSETMGLGGIDGDVLRLFNDLDLSRKCEMFRHYGRAHGASAAKYALNKMSDWASGSVTASGQTRARLLALVPKVLSESERYELLKKLYAVFRANDSESHSITVLLGHAADFRQKILELATRLCNKPSLFQLPVHVQSRITWVCDNDSIVARKLMAAIETEESISIARAGQEDVARLIQRLSSTEAAVEGVHTLIFPYGRINVHVRKPNLFEKIGKLFSS